MAISLASGVLVSTLLTLVVIPRVVSRCGRFPVCAVAGTKCKKFSRATNLMVVPAAVRKAAATRRRPALGACMSGFATVMFTVIGGVVALVDLFGGLFETEEIPRTRRRPSCTCTKPKATESTVTPEASTPVAVRR